MTTAAMKENVEAKQQIDTNDLKVITLGRMCPRCARMITSRPANPEHLDEVGQTEIFCCVDEKICGKKFRPIPIGIQNGTVIATVGIPRRPAIAFLDSVDWFKELGVPRKRKSTGKKSTITQLRLVK